MKQIAAIFVEKHGPYSGITGVEVWDRERDARSYRGPHPVVAHPPCERWGRYWSGGPSAKVRRLKGDDEGCFDRALWAVRNFKGVLEHPAHSSAWAYYGLPRPPSTGGWYSVRNGEFVCEVEQGNYGHPARKATWLLVCGRLPFDLMWGPSSGKLRLDEGFHSKEERAKARAAGQPPRKRLSKDENVHTPIAFRDVLLEIARGCK